MLMLVYRLSSIATYLTIRAHHRYPSVAPGLLRWTIRIVVGYFALLAALIAIGIPLKIIGMIFGLGW